MLPLVEVDTMAQRPTSRARPSSGGNTAPSPSRTLLRQSKAGEGSAFETVAFMDFSAFPIVNWLLSAIDLGVKVAGVVEDEGNEAEVGASKGP